MNTAITHQGRAARQPVTLTTSTLAPLTPGPWRRAPGNAFAALQVIGADRRLVARIPHGPDPARIEADSRLITQAYGLAYAARDLVARLDSLTSEQLAAGGDQVEREHLRAILAGILGETEG